MRGWILSLALLGTVANAAAATRKDGGAKVPITTASDEARELYLKGRDLSEKLRALDARKQFQQAVEKDPGFALGHLQLALTSGTNKEFWAGLNQAVALEGKVSDGERLWIQAVEAGAKAQAPKQKELLTKLAKSFPGDERAQNLLGGWYFGQQDFPAAIEQYEKAIKINPSFSQPYNQLGYAYRSLEKFDKAEQAFKKYIELIPGDPNPYDSYAELLMKTGRFEESIKSYEKALAQDPNFVASYIGIGNDQIFMGKGDEARRTFGKLLAQARSDGEKRQALFWTAVSYVYEGATDKAIAEVQKEAAVAQASGDLVALSADHALMANILLEAGKPDEALAEYQKQTELLGKADVPAEVKDAQDRQMIADRARVALAKKDLATAKTEVAAFAKVAKQRFEVYQQHELAGLLAGAQGDHATAVKELSQANEQDPRVLFELAAAFAAKGDAAKAREVCTKAAAWNGLGVNYAYVRGKAKAMLARSS